MWGSQSKGGGKPPPIPSNSERSSSYLSKAHQHQEQELEQLRQRGLAKVLHKHLQSVCRKLANEQAAADAALVDLNARKANMSEFQVSSELVGIESLVLKATKWKAECRQKEKEALLLYQRYCDKFGKQNPSSTPKKEDANSSAPMSPLSPESPALSAKLAAPPPSTPPVLPNIAEDLSNLPGILKDGVSIDGLQDDDFRQYYRDQTKNEESESFLEEPLLLQDDDNLSIVSGLTSINSTVTRTIMPLVEKDVQEFLHQEQFAIQELLASEEDQGTENSSDLGSVAKMTEQAETMAQQMQEMLQSFDTSEEITSEERAAPKPRRVLDENWSVYYDETFQREYYYHKVSGKSQWESPHELMAADESTSSTTMVNSVETDGKVSRIALYRQRLRKRRRRQRRLVVVLVGASLLAAGGCLWHARNQAFQKAVHETQQAEEARVRAAQIAQEKRVAEEAARRQEAEALARQETLARDARNARDRLDKIATAPKKAAHRALAMDAYCAHVTPDSPLASLCF